MQVWTQSNGITSKRSTCTLCIEFSSGTLQQFSSCNLLWQVPKYRRRFYCCPTKCGPYHTVIVLAAQIFLHVARAPNSTSQPSQAESVLHAFFKRIAKLNMPTYIFQSGLFYGLAPSLYSQDHQKSRLIPSSLVLNTECT